jgi:hypothetical protein
VRAGLAALATALLATACGGSTPVSGTAWAAAHPDPQGIHFAEAQGLCTITVRYPTEAPGEIDYGSIAYIQRDSIAKPASPGKEIGRSGDWTVHQQDAHTLILVTPAGAFSYKDGANCGNNSAAPS